MFATIAVRRLNQADQDKKRGRRLAEEQLDEVVAHHQDQHRESEQRDVAEKARVARIVVHVARVVDMHHQRDEGDDAHHHRGQVVDEKADVEFNPGDGQPGVDGIVERLAVGEAVAADKADSRNDMATPAIVTVCTLARRADRPASSVRRRARQQRRRRDQQIKGFACSLLFLSLQAIQFFDFDQTQVAEQHDEGRQANLTFGRGNGQDEENRYLAVQVTEV